MDSDFEAVIAQERQLLDPRVRNDGAAVRALLHDEFSEFGASGTRWDRESVVRALGGDTDVAITADNLRPFRLGPDAVLLTYTSRRGDATSLRTSVWIRENDTWLLLHHQGTRAPT